ncbi:universal stress protein [Marinobacter sp. CHS3-4]|uniref:universal stress protein n=1 Tax=Marinobacter sp. CHS3-4 TaxID=3045174 RepID=UPI0024B5A5AF|nr:universal stress protein [Marinobacter sp. CHS3-4]MDI9244262.1 universal stress protein [Marinobacter sp. CHS3-4]
MSKKQASVIIACDGSGHSENVAKTAATLAKALDLPLKLLTVFPGSRAERLIISGVWPSDLEEEKKEFGESAFEAASKALKGQTQPDEKILLQGEPAHEIIEYLDEHPAAHLVMGRRGHSLVKSLTLGSICEKVVRHASNPVTVVSE